MNSMVCDRLFLFRLAAMGVLFVTASVGQAESLKVDFGNSPTASVQNGYEVYSAVHENEASFTSQSYSAFGSTVSVTPSWTSGAAATAMQMLDRNPQDYEDTTEDLMRDWIGTDTRSAGNPLTLSIKGLPAGTYTWTSYHHDTAAANMGQFDVTVHDAKGAIATTGIQISGNAVTSFSDVSTFKTTLVSDGADISLTFEQLPYSAEYNQAWFVMNGFEIAEAAVSEQAVAIGPLRRPTSPDQPMWIIHIDTWNYADPQKIIDLVPSDIRPFVVFNIGMSISHDDDGWSKVDSGYETAKSWLRTCARNRVWAMIQPASGGYSHFPDDDLSVYEEFFREYPNFLGFNYCEQFWGFGDPPLSPSWEDRVAHWARLLPLTAKYGGYLTVSWCGNQWSPSINPMAMFKRNPDFAAACEAYTENFILCEKYTQQSYQSDMESLCLGAYLSGYSGNCGIRYDSTGWTDSTVTNDSNFTMATAGAPHLEHAMLTGETVIDGPELIWTQCFHGGGTVTQSDGYKVRTWYKFPQFENMSIDLFRKILDGTVRIPTRQEVIDRTKVVILNDVAAGSIDDIYSTPETLFEGLYRMDGDGNLRNNKTFFKKTGRYPTIPTVFNLADEAAQSFEVQINQSAYSARWPNLAAKVAEFDALFPEEYTGDIYAGRHENGWVVYNPHKTTNTNGISATGSIPLKYNTCDRMDLSLAQYTAGVIKETATNLTFYLNNHDSEIGLGMRTDTIAIHGSTVQPTYVYTDRADHDASTVSSRWTDGVFTLSITHNGPLDLTVSCEGTNSTRLTEYTSAAIAAPAPPRVYTGALQYEGEFFDYKNIAGNVTDGDYLSPPPVTNYTGQGYLKFGTGSAASVRDKVTVLKSGTYRIETRYSNPNGNVNTIDLHVNGSKAADLSLSQTETYSDWKLNTVEVNLNAGENTIEYIAGGAAPSSVYFDNFVVVPTAYEELLVIEENDAGYIDALESETDCIYWALDFDATTPKSFTFRYAATNELTANLFVNDTNVAANIRFPSTGSFDEWDYMTVYPVVPSGKSTVRLESSEGLPRINSLEVGGATAWAWSSDAVPFVPPGLSASAISTTQVRLDWANAPGAERYTVKRAESIDGPYTTIATDVSGSEYIDTGLSELTTYYYGVSAVNANGESEDSDTTSVTTHTVNPPAAPTSLDAAGISYRQIDLSWDAVLGADHYIVKRAIISGGPYVTIALDVSGTSFSDTTLFADTTYYYVISAVNAVGEGLESAETNSATLSTGTLAPIADTYVRDGGSADTNFGTDPGLVVKNDGGTGTGYNRNSFLKFDVSELADATSVQLQLTPYQVDSGDSMYYQLLLDDSWNETEMTWNTQPTEIGGVAATASAFVVGQTYSVNITEAATGEAEGDGILSLKLSKPNGGNNFVGFRSREYSDAALCPVLQVTIPHVDYPVPEKPEGLAVGDISSAQVDLIWSASVGASSYHVKRSTSWGGAYTLIAVGVSDMEFSDPDLTDGQIYYYKVSAINGSGESADSEIVCTAESAEIMPDEYVLHAVLEGETLNLMLESSVPGHTYILQGKEHLSDPEWTETDPVMGTGSNLLYDIPISEMPESYFFKLDVQRQ